MDKTDPPLSFGVFKPVGHTVVAFRHVADLEAATQALRDQGFLPDTMVEYSPGEMVAQVEAERASASPLAALGQEQNLIEAHRLLALAGCSFLVVHAPDDEQAAQVATVASHHRAAAAQRYNRFFIEELIADAPGEQQVFESPARGLDLPVDPGR
ncbi:MAG: hypothetical protein H7242_01530 [Microbacteriaceae bacterium]|nr:hypothetical protein [Burkholderiaceae bacterium]